MKNQDLGEDHSEQVRVRFEKLVDLKNQKENPYKNGLVPTALAQSLHEAYDSKTKVELEALAISCSVAGRVMAIRDFGKASFLRLQDRTGLIQAFIQKNQVGDEAYALYKNLDVGDFVFTEGLVFKTKTGELSVHSRSLSLVTKALRPLPEKFHGIADVEIKYRQRYLDLMMSESTRETFKKRSKIIEEMRNFFTAHHFMEVETPMMHPIAGGATARPFVTHHHALDMTLLSRKPPENCNVPLFE